MNTTPEITPDGCAAIYGGSTAPQETAPQEPTSQEPASSQETAEHAQGKPSVEELIAEAEQRGYLKGRNEAIAEAMKQPAMWQPVEPLQEPSPLVANFLKNMSKGVWN